MMSEAFLVMTAALVLIAGQVRADDGEAPPREAEIGHIAWFDLTTTDLAGSKEFYGNLFDWRFAPVEGTDLAVEIVAGGTSIGTIRVAEGAISAANGVVYVQVEDILASCSKAKELGGTVVPGFPFNIPDVGAIALVIDPAGHPVGMYSKTQI